MRLQTGHAELTPGARAAATEVVRAILADLPDLGRQLVAGDLDVF